jgi:voltage-gated potassium channel
LIAILPLDALFSFFRIARIIRITKVSRLSHLGRLVGVSGKMTNRLSDFLKINGFINVLYTSLILIILSSLTFSYAENLPLPESLWWAFVTATTVGYGDVAPHTVLGKLAAILLMFLGIGFISLLTSTITEYFNRNTVHEQTEMDEKIDLLLQKIDHLEKQVSELNKREINKK